MRSSSVLLVLSLLPSTLVGQAVTDSYPASSRVSTLVGVGNSFGGVGVLADFKPFDRGPLSFVGSVGLVSGYFHDGSESSVALALGVRANAGHGKHQGFAELALLPVDADVVGHLEFPPRVALLYGLGLQLGYRATLTQGITVNAMGGAGYALDSESPQAAHRLRLWIRLASALGRRS
jgi:hypothetical protein